ncbi:MAG TPA: hypothetical protein VFF02_07135 [Anaeromyxobacteraceae bacterium]|nr:hypothetical protein [Anaeromyxobacteraceae bacterium]
MRRPAAALLALLHAGAAAAAVARPTTVEQLARESDAVVQGRVVARESRWAPDGRHILTRVTVRVSRVIRGSAGAEVTLEVPGGEVGGFGQRVDAAPSFQPGEEAVVFLRRTAAGRTVVHGMGQGKFRVQDGEARPDVEGWTFVPEPIPAGERRAERMPVAELERRVRAAR